MNYVTREIMAKCKVSAELALKIQNEMGCMGLDFSECSQRQFNAFMKQAYQTIMLQQNEEV